MIKMIAKIRSFFRELRAAREERYQQERIAASSRQFQIKEMRGAIVITCNGVPIRYFKPEATVQEIMIAITGYRALAWNYEQLRYDTYTQGPPQPLQDYR